MRTVLGCVPYVNAKPIIDRFHFGGPTDVEVVYDVPSRLPALLDSGQACAVLASSYEALSTPGRTIGADVSISTFGPAESVRLFSKVPPATIQSLALDKSSLTSNHLALVILKERYDCEPLSEPLPPSLVDMLATHDACILIGNQGMTANGECLHVLDLGEEWSALTGLPFVWATWIGTQDLTPIIVSELIQAKRWGLDHLEDVIARASEDSGISLNQCDHYLREVMDFDLTDLHVEGLRKFRELLIQNDLLDPIPFPEIVGASQTTSV